MATPASRHPRALPLAVLGISCLPAACGSGSESSSQPAPTISQTSATVEIGKIRWHVDYEQARAIARASNKPLWVHFGEHPG
ncbi:MAG: hypothetical protein FJ299_01740 [Planctomycetes bacterium]|nr:hypothetical protein [Planctomycetota bacterium]